MRPSRWRIIRPQFTTAGNIYQYTIVIGLRALLMVDLGLISVNNICFLVLVFCFQFECDSYLALKGSNLKSARRRGGSTQHVTINHPLALSPPSQWIKRLPRALLNSCLGIKLTTTLYQELLIHTTIIHQNMISRNENKL